MAYQELTFTELLPYALIDLQANLTPALLGKAGIGKSEFIEALSRELQTSVFVLPVNQLGDRSDLTGVRTVPKTDPTTGEITYSQIFFPHDIIAQAIAYAHNHPEQTPILFMDEFNRAGSDITSAILSFQTLRRVGSIDFPDNLRMVIAGNVEGNVTSLDEASITRFSIYYVKPDMAKFLEVNPDLNAYIGLTLNKNNELLVAEPLQEGVVSVQGDDDDDDSAEQTFLATMSAGQGSFDQWAVPRTISGLSKWLNIFGLDNSGTDAEKAKMTEAFGVIGSQSSTDSKFLAVLQGKTGRTTFTEALYNEMMQAYNLMISGSFTATTQSQLAKYRPSQNTVNKLVHAKDLSEIEQFIPTQTPEELQNTIIWLFDQRSVNEVNNNDAVKFFVKIATEFIGTFGPNHSQGIILAISTPTDISELTMKSFMNSDSPTATMYKQVIESAMGWAS